MYISTPLVRGKEAAMIIKPEKAYTILWFSLLLLLPISIYFSNDSPKLIVVIIGEIASIIVTFTKAFSIYTLDYDGITQKCIFIFREFKWESFKYIGVQKLTGGTTRAGGYCLQIRCSTVSLPKSMSIEQFEKKMYWRPSKTITIPWPDKNGDKFYREFLSYCGGERDIRE